MDQLIEQIAQHATESFFESLGRTLVLMIPIGLIYGKLLKKYRWAAFVLAVPVAASLDAIATTVGAATPYLLLISAGACVVAIELASMVLKKGKAQSEGMG